VRDAFVKLSPPRALPTASREFDSNDERDGHNFLSRAAGFRGRCNMIQELLD